MTARHGLQKIAKKHALNEKAETRRRNCVKMERRVSHATEGQRGGREWMRGGERKLCDDRSKQEEHTARSAKKRRTQEKKKQKKTTKWCSCKGSGDSSCRGRAGGGGEGTASRATTGANRSEGGW